MTYGNHGTARPERLRVARATFGPTPGLVLDGELDFASASVLDEHLRLVAEDGHTDLVIDVSRLDRCDSAGLSVLIGAARRAQRHTRSVELRGVGRPLGRMLEVTGIAPLFRVGDTSDRADAVG